jgi:hypothetical protein
MAPLEFTNQEFSRVRNEAEQQYRAYGQIACPYFQGPVAFNTEGFRHIVFKSWNRGRDPHDQFMRLKYLFRAPEILRLSRTVQGIQETQGWERRRRHGRWEKLLTPVTYYEFIAVLDGRRFKVIVKQLPDGQRIFWSLIPFWRQSEEGRRLLHDGKPETD